MAAQVGSFGAMEDAMKQRSEEMTGEMREAFQEALRAAQAFMDAELAERLALKSRRAAGGLDAADAPAADGGGSGSPRQFGGHARRLSQMFLAPRIPDLSYLRGSANLGYALRGYGLFLPMAVAVVLAGLLAGVVLEYAELLRAGQLAELWHAVRIDEAQSTLVAAVGLAFLGGLVLAALGLTRRRPVYLVDFAVLKPPAEWRVDAPRLFNIACNTPTLLKRSIQFMVEVGRRAGVSHLGTYLPPAITEMESKTTMASRREAEVVMFGVLDELFEKTGLKPRDVDILIVNCSLFNPTPSLTAMIINHYGMRTNIQSYNLSGMGCSAGLISVNLANDLLQARPNANAVIVSTENITQNFYLGNQRSMLIPNMLFRVGGAGVLLSNKWRDAGRAKYRLQHVLRTNRAADDAAYHTVFQREDEDGVLGVKLDKGLMNVAGECLKINLTTLGPLVLPWSEQIKFAINLVRRKVLKHKLPMFVPNFRKAFQHFCIQPGGRGVIDALEENLRLSKLDVEASREALFHYGNTSSAGIWYELAYSENKGRVRRGDKVWQISVGSGFKCNSAVWKANRHIDSKHQAWECVDDHLELYKS